MWCTLWRESSWCYSPLSLGTNLVEILYVEKINDNDNGKGHHLIVVYLAIFILFLHHCSFMLSVVLDDSDWEVRMDADAAVYRPYRRTRDERRHRKQR